MNLEDETKKHLEKIKSDLEYRGESIFSSLVENKEVYLNSIPESVFVNYFLPCLLGNVNNPNWIMEWVSIAGSPSSEVGVFDDASKQLLYYVPPILNTNELLLANRENNLANIFARYKMYNNNLPIEGDRFLNHELNNKTIELSNINNRFIDSWYNILRRYNIIAINENIENNNSNLDNFLDY